MTKLETRAEILKLARLLGGEPGSLAALEELPADDVRALREQVTDRLFGADAGTLGRLAAAGRLLPPPLLATIAERVFGPLLCARVAGVFDVKRAVDVAGRLDASFLADVAIELEPRRAREVIARIPAAKVAEVARELVAREEWVTMGRFVAHVPDPSLIAALGVTDDRGVLEIGFVLEGKDRLDHLVGLLPEDRIGGLIEAAAAAALWEEAIDLLGHLGDGLRQRVVAAGADREALRDPSVLAGLVRAAVDSDLWADLLPLVARLPPEGRAHVAAAAAALGGDEHERLLAAVDARGLWAEMIGLLTALAEQGGDDLDSLLDLVDDSMLERAAAVVGRLPGQDRARLVELAAGVGVLDRLGPVKAALLP